MSETFAANELLALARNGSLAAIFATKPGDDAVRQPQMAALAPYVHVLRDGSEVQQASEVADRLRGAAVDAVHGYFAHVPARVAELAAHELGVRWGFSVHALDARKVEPRELARRAIAASVVVACNSDVESVLCSVGAQPTMLRHGVDLQRFGRSSSGDAGSPQAGELLAVGRLVEKKGFRVLLEAIARTRRPARLRIVGDGPLLGDLQTAADLLGLRQRVVFAGRKTHDELPGEYLRSSIVVVPSVVDSGGDRDGLPNVVLEAMASSRAVIASDVAAIASAVTDGVTGLLVRPGDAEALARRIDRLLDDQQLAQELGANARERVEREFALESCTRRFIDALEDAYVRN